MRKSMWLLAASAVLLPVVAQGAITFKVEDKTIVANPATVTTDAVDVFAIVDGADVGRAFNGFFVTATVPASSGISFIAPFAKRTDDPNPPPLVPLARTQYLSSANLTPLGNPNATSTTFQGFVDTAEVLQNGEGLVRIPIAIAPTSQNQTFTITLTPATVNPEGNILNFTEGFDQIIVNPELSNGTINVIGVPEPASLGLLALGGLFGLRRRRVAVA